MRCFVDFKYLKIGNSIVIQWKFNGTKQRTVPINPFTHQSQRYVDEANCDFIIPESIKNNPEALNLYNSFMEKAKDTYLKLREMNILKEDARYVLPNATATEIILTANFSFPGTEEDFVNYII